MDAHYWILLTRFVYCSEIGLFKEGPYTLVQTIACVFVVVGELIIKSYRCKMKSTQDANSINHVHSDKVCDSPSLCREATSPFQIRSREDEGCGACLSVVMAQPWV